jgi:hypothetical protein
LKGRIRTPWSLRDRIGGLRQSFRVKGLPQGGDFSPRLEEKE